MEESNFQRLVQSQEPRCCPNCGASGRLWRGHGWRNRKISISGEAVTRPVLVHRLRCYGSCRRVWNVQVAQIARYRRYEIAQMATVIEARASGLSWSVLERRFSDISSSVQRSWVRGIVANVPGLLSGLSSWAARNLINWIPPVKVQSGGLLALLGLVASLQECTCCSEQWLEWLQTWTYTSGTGTLIAATTCCGGRGP